MKFLVLSTIMRYKKGKKNILVNKQKITISHQSPFIPLLFIPLVIFPLKLFEVGHHLPSFKEDLFRYLALQQSVFLFKLL